MSIENIFPTVPSYLEWVNGSLILTETFSGGITYKSEVCKIINENGKWYASGSGKVLLKPLEHAIDVIAYLRNGGDPSPIFVKKSNDGFVPADSLEASSIGEEVVWYDTYGGKHTILDCNHVGDCLVSDQRRQLDITDTDCIQEIVYTARINLEESDSSPRIIAHNVPSGFYIHHPTVKDGTPIDFDKEDLDNEDESCAYRDVMHTANHIQYLNPNLKVSRSGNWGIKIQSDDGSTIKELVLMERRAW